MVHAADIEPRPAVESALTAAQAQQFVRDGFCMVPSLISSDVIEALHRRLWDRYGIDVHKPETFDHDKAESISGNDQGLQTSMAMTAQLQAAGKALAGPETIFGHGFTPIPRIPKPGPKAFEPMGYHMDGVRAGLTLYPGRRALIMVVYLTDTDEHGGATSIFPGSHRKVFEWAREQGVDEEGRFMQPGRHNPPELDYGDPIALPMKAGDVGFMHYLCVHGGSRNCHSHLRIMLNGVARPSHDDPYQPKVGGPAADWTPLDYTLRTDNLG